MDNAPLKILLAELLAFADVEVGDGDELDELVGMLELETVVVLVVPVMLVVE